MKNVLEGLKIFDKYEAPGKNHGFAAEHDQIWCGDLELTISEEDKVKLAKLGWFEDEEVGSWTKFV